MKKEDIELDALMRMSIAILLVVFATSCRSDELEVKVYELRHVVEEPSPSSDSFKYYYSDQQLDTTEIQILSEIFDKKGYLYFISSDGRFYHDRSQIVNIGAAFVIDNELIDSIVARNLPRSPFVKEVLQNAH